MKAATLTAIVLFLAGSNLSAGPVESGALLSGANIPLLLKGLKTATAGTITPPSAPAKPTAAVTTFSGNSHWTSGGSNFSPLEQLGVQKSAEENAVLLCQEGGNVGCVATVSQITTCDYSSCDATAVARVLPAQQGTSVKGAARWTKGGYGFSALEQLGVQESAEQNAVLNCQKQGLSDCAPIGSQITDCNSTSCEASALAIGH